MKFSEYLWQKNTATYQSIVEHPFNVELAAGVLSEERFAFYMQQDAYYLIERSRSFALIAARTDVSSNIQQFLNLAIDGLIAEQEFHTKFAAPSYDWDLFEPSYSCLAYTNFLVAKTATGSIEEALSALLPCYWIYRELGQLIGEETVEDNRYADWIKTYSDPGFSKKTDGLIEMLDNMAVKCSKSTLLRIEKAFEYGSRFEWHFWNDAYEMKTFAKEQKLPSFAFG